MLRSRLGPYFSWTTSDLPTRASSVRKSLMYPCSLRISAMFALIFECGRVTSSWYAELALRRRVKKSAIGSVMVMTASSPSSRRFPLPNSLGWAYRNLFVSSCGPLPAGLLHAGQFARMRHLPQADSAQAELAVHGVGAAAPVATCVAAHLELGLLVGLVDQSLLCHLLSSP